MIARRGGFAARLAGISCGLITLASISLAQESEEAAPNDPAEAPATEPSAGRALSIEEIIVTAQKREQKFQDVPISMSVVTGDFLRDQGVGDFRDLATYLPNVSMTVEQSQGGYFTGGANIRVRGFGTAVGADTFEQPVGMAIDGDSYSKLPPFIGGLFDVERIEVLKGPQGTLFGKNTTAGLVNMTTKSPTDEYTGFIDARAGKYDSRRLEAAVGGPVIKEYLNVRIAGLTDERNGWMENTTARINANADEVEGGYDRKGVRFKAEVPSFYGFTLKLSQELTESESEGSTTEWVRTDSDPSPVNYFRRYDPDAEFEKDNHLNSLDVPQLVKTKTRRLIADVAYDFSDWRVNGLIGVSKFEIDGHFDGEGFPVPINDFRQSTEQPQTNFELRLNSPTLPGFFGLESIAGVPLGSLEFTVGFFYQQRDFDYVNDWIGSAPLIGEYGVVLQTGFYPPLPPGSGGTMLVPPLVQRLTIFSDDSRSPAGYGQMSWHFAERFTLEFGARYTVESREGSWDQIANNAFGEQFWSTVGFMFFTTTAERNDSAFTPKVALKYDWSDDITFFATRATGFKSGGFNASASNSEPQSLQFEPEHATSYDVGTKARFFDGQLAVNAALFWTEMEDMQSLVLLSATLPTGQPSPLGAQYVVKNAGQARSRGFELDATWLATDWLTTLATAALADTEYLEFPNGTCANDRPDPDPEIPGCDLSGRPFEFTPRWTATFTPQLHYPITGIPGLRDSSPLVRGIELLGSVTVRWEDVQKANRAADPRGRQSSFFKLNANVGFGNPEQGWSAGFWVQNLTDEYTLLDSFFNIPHAMMLTPAPPRTFYGGIRWEF